MDATGDGAVRFQGRQNTGAHLVFGKTANGGILSACIQDNGQGKGPPDRAVVVARPAGQGFRRIGGAMNGNVTVHGS